NDRILFCLLATTAFVLLIACANVANLMMARTERRQQELAIRGALGAGRGRLMRQMLTESVILTGLGGLAGLVISVWGMRALVLLLPQRMARLREFQIDGHALGFTLLISIASGLVLGVAPAIRSTR